MKNKKLFRGWFHENKLKKSVWKKEEWEKTRDFSELSWEEQFLSPTVMNEFYVHASAHKQSEELN